MQPIKTFYGLVFFILGMATMHVIRVYHEPKESAADRLIALADGFLVSRALYAVAEFRIADQLCAGPKTAYEVAQALDLHPEAVHRLLRMLAAHGVFTHLPNDTFALNSVAELLTTNHPQSLQGFLLHEDPTRWQAYGDIAYTLKTGKPAFNHRFGEGYFEYIARDRKRSEQFDKGMANISEEENKRIAATINFSPFKHIVDVGGGVGGLLAAIIHAYPSLYGTLYELPHLVPLAQEYVAKQQLTDHITIIAGSFLNEVVSGGDLYVLKRILHDWDDETCVKILKNCRAAMGDTGRIFVFDCIVPEGGAYDISKDIDITIMLIFGGKERTRKDFEGLCASANLKLWNVSAVPGTMLSCIEIGTRK